MRSARGHYNLRGGFCACGTEKSSGFYLQISIQTGRLNKKASHLGRGGSACRAGEGFANAQAFAGVAETGVGFANAQAFAGVAETGVGFANAQAFAGVAETGVCFARLVNLSRRVRLRESTQTVRAMDMQVRPAPSGFSRTTFGSLERSEIAGIAGESAKNPTKLQNRLDKGGKV